MNRRAGLLARAIATASLIAGDLLSAARTPAQPLEIWTRVSLGVTAALLGALPLILPRHGQRPWAAPLALVGFVGLAAVGLQLDLAAGWMLLAVVAALCAWDLEHLEERLSHPGYAGSQAAHRAMEKGHLRRLMSVATVGFFLGSAALLVQARITFLPAVLLSLLALLGLSWLVSFFRAWGE
jgi:hypothetical protein